MSSVAAWSALADRFADVTTESPIEYTTHAEDASAFNAEVPRTRVLLRSVDEGRQTPGRIISIRSNDADPESGRTKVNRFRWLCWSAGLLLDPYQPYQPPEVSWLLHVTSKGNEPVADIADWSARRATQHAKDGRLLPPRPAEGLPNSWWRARRKAFKKLAKRFSAPVFRESHLHVTIGQRYLPTAPGGAVDPDLWEFNPSREGRSNSNRPYFIRRDPGGAIWGEKRAMEEFIKLSEAAYNSLPAELQIGMGVPFFPPTPFLEHTSFRSAWWRWAVIVWALCPNGFRCHLPEMGEVPFISSEACPEITAGAACDRIADTPDCLQLIEHVRRSLTGLNLWLDMQDQAASRQAVDAAYLSRMSTPPAGPVPRLPADRLTDAKRKRGRPPAKSSTPDRVKSDIKLLEDWKVSGLNRKAFLKLRGIDETEGLKTIDRGRKHVDSVRRMRPAN